MALLAVVSMASLAGLCLAWEMWIAPLRPGGSWLALKALPAIVPLAGLIQRRRYTFQWASLLAWGYVAEGLVRSFAEEGPARAMAILELSLAVVFFAAAVAHLRAARRPPGSDAPARAAD